MNSTRSNLNRNPRVLLVTTELAHLPQGMVGNADWLTARAGGVAEVTASLVSALYEQGIDIHVALPDYRSLFRNRVRHPVPEKELFYRNKSPLNRVHLAADRILFHQPRLCYGGGLDGDKVALAFQREVINDIIPRVQPDLIHCNDWMTGLIPAMARQFNIPCLFTFHNTHNCNLSMAQIEDRGIDAAGFWEHLYFNRMPANYTESRGTNPVDLLTSGVFGAHFVNTVSATFLQEILQGEHPFVDPALEQVLMERCQDECAGDIRNAPDPSFDPATDKALFRRYNASDHAPAKQFNKLFLQDKLGLVMDSQAPLFFWPSRLDMHQKGCPLLSEILHEVVANHWDDHLEIVFVADGEFKAHFQNIVQAHQLEGRVAICDFDETLARQVYGAADFVLMPSRYEPCGLPQMIGSRYGVLPVAHKTGGLMDTIVNLNAPGNRGNGFLFETFDAGGLRWAIEQAMGFYRLPLEIKSAQIQRVMEESKRAFDHTAMVNRYQEIYEELLQRPLN